MSRRGECDGLINSGAAYLFEQNKGDLVSCVVYLRHRAIKQITKQARLFIRSVFFALKRPFATSTILLYHIFVRSPCCIL